MSRKLISTISETNKNNLLANIVADSEKSIKTLSKDFYNSILAGLEVQSAHGLRKLTTSFEAKISESFSENKSVSDLRSILTEKNPELAQSIREESLQLTEDAVEGYYQDLIARIEEVSEKNQENFGQNCYSEFLGIVQAKSHKSILKFSEDYYRTLIASVRSIQKSQISWVSGQEVADAWYENLIMKIETKFKRDAISLENVLLGQEKKFDLVESEPGLNGEDLKFEAQKSVFELSKQYFDMLLENFVSSSSEVGVPDWGSVKTLETEAIEEVLKKSEIEVWSLCKDLPYPSFEVGKNSVVTFCQGYYEGLLSGIKAQSSRDLANLHQKTQIGSNRSVFIACQNYYETLRQKLELQSNREICNIESQISIKSLSMSSRANSARQVAAISKQFYTDIIANLRLTSEIEINSLHNLKTSPASPSQVNSTQKSQIHSPKGSNPNSIRDIAANFLKTLISNLNLAPSAIDSKIFLEQAFSLFHPQTRRLLGEKFIGISRIHAALIQTRLNTFFHKPAKSHFPKKLH